MHSLAYKLIQPSNMVLILLAYMMLLASHDTVSLLFIIHYAASLEVVAQLINHTTFKLTVTDDMPEDIH